MTDSTLPPPPFSRAVNDGLVRLTQLCETRSALLDGRLGDFDDLKDAFVDSLDGEIASFRESLTYNGRYFHEKTKARQA